MDKVPTPSLNSSDLAVQVVSASKTYLGGNQALLPVNLNIQRGEFVSLLGPSGCGKSTLLKMIAGLASPTSGAIKLWPKVGHSPQSTDSFSEHTPPRPSQIHEPRLSFVFQSPTLMPWADVKTNVRLPLDLAGVPRDLSDSSVDEVLTRVGLTDFADALPRELSGGMQMRVSIARGLVTQPDILLMDEPFGALDEITRHKLDSDLLSLWQKQNLTIIFVTHSIHEAVFLSNRVIMMAARPGRITEEFLIEQPYPRSSEFMVKPEFMHYAGLLQRSLEKASVANH